MFPNHQKRNSQVEPQKRINDELTKKLEEETTIIQRHFRGMPKNIAERIAKKRMGIE